MEGKFYIEEDDTQTSGRKQVDYYINSKPLMTKVCKFHVHEKSTQIGVRKQVDYLINSKPQIVRGGRKQIDN